ncbi:hypothetical protein CRM22_009072 [Opisthorchis felineus]|uniref:Uncharacterized protein n=1 Tax=Opisthorchis felineus TaxID=147828 RepID=A0A4S2L880_OPIFE|nr:hypothetical protein CRM22_009072 [Opisthorchis felineus]
MDPTTRRTAVGKSLTVRILPKDPWGTLDGKTTGDLTLMAGDEKTLQCGLLPPDAAEGLNGLWNATANPPEAATIKIPEGHTKAEILPPNEQGFFEVPGEFSVQCVFYSPENTVIPKTETTDAGKYSPSFPDVYNISILKS